MPEIQKTVLFKITKYLILDLAIDTLFKGIYKNFRVLYVDRNTVKIGDRFPRIDFYYGDNIFSHHNCEIKGVMSNLGYVTIKYEYVTDEAGTRSEMNSMSTMPIDNLIFVKYATI
jgi:hypothetical protein